MPPAVSQTDYYRFLNDLRQIQSQLFDKASNYTRLILGLGYGGFFAAWSGTKQNLNPLELVGSALLVTFSLFLYLVFEIWQTRTISMIALEFASARNDPKRPLEPLEELQASTHNMGTNLFKVWKVVFPACAVTGLLGGLILIFAFVHTLLRLL